MNFGYALAQGLAGAAKAGAGIADQQMKEAAEERAANRQLEIQMRLDAAREMMAMRADERRRSATKEDEAASWEREKERAPEKRAMKSADTEAGLLAQYSDAVVNAKTEAAKQQAETELEFFKEHKSEILAKKAAEARAGHIDDGAGLRGLQMESAKMSLEEKKKVTGLIEEYENTTDPKRKAQVREALITRGVLKPNSGEFETEKVTEKTSDMATGKETTVERTQRRNASESKEPKGTLVISSKAEYDKLPSGTKFTAPDGKIRIKP